MLQQKHIGWLLLLLLIMTKPYAQAPGFKMYLPEDNSTKFQCLYKSTDGYILAGTTHGLLKFDGIRFKKIELNGTDTISAIYQDKKGVIWAGCNSGRIATLIKGKLEYINPEEGTPHKRITAFTEDAYGNIWFGTHGEGLYYFKGKRLYLINEENGLSDLHIHSLAMSQRGEILVGTDQGINVYSTQNSVKKIVQINPSEGLPDYIVTAIFNAGNDNFWIGLQDKGFCLYNHLNQKITIPAAVNNWSKGQVNDIRYSHNNVCIATQDSGIFYYNTLQGRLYYIDAESPKSTTGITEDEQGNTWFIYGNSAIVKVSVNTLQVHPVYTESFFPTSHTIYIDHENNFWAGTDMAVVKYSTTAKGYLSKKYPVSGLDYKTDITSLYEDDYYNIWIGTMGRGIFILNPATGKTRQLTEASPGGSILSITGRGKTICAAGLEGAIVFELSGTHSDINTPYTFTAYTNIESVGSNYVYNVFKDSRSRIWFATDGSGLTVLDNGRYIHYTEKNGIKDDHIYAVTEDKKGNIWFSTSSAGVYCFNGKSFTNYGIAEGLSSLNVAAVKTAKNGNIAVVHKEGIDIIDINTGTVSYVNAGQGIQDINDDLGAVCTDAAGSIYMASKNGIVQYTGLTDVSNMPKAIIENVQLFLNNIDTAARHQFAFDENNLTFNFISLYYTNPEKIFYEYKLEGLFNEWQFTKDNTKTFPRLPPGKYVFKVRSSLNKNFSNAEEAVFAFEIKKPFWKNWWFITILMAAVSFLLYWYIRKREYNLKNVERLEGEKIKFEFETLRNQVNPHFLFNSFNTLISTIEDNPSQAVEYVEHLSDFFRSIVNYRDKNTIALREEVQLLKNYLYLQQKRYGSSLQLLLDIDDKNTEQCLIPPLTLQLLVENAIKHNAVSKEAALCINIVTDNEYVVVKNNTNKKITKEIGTGMGLPNIKSRYALLTEKPVLILESDNYFIVKLPILK